MELSNEPVEGKIIYPLKSFGFGVTLMLCGTFSTIGLARWLNIPAIGVAGFLVFFVGYLYYNKFIKNYFSKRVLFVFREFDFSVQELNLRTGVLEKITDFQYQDIESCTLKTIKDKYLELFIRFKNKEKKSFMFIDDSEVNASEIIYQYVTTNIR